MTLWYTLAAQHSPAQPTQLHSHPTPPLLCYPQPITTLNIPFQAVYASLPVIGFPDALLAGVIKSLGLTAEEALFSTHTAHVCTRGCRGATSMLTALSSPNLAHANNCNLALLLRKFRSFCLGLATQFWTSSAWATFQALLPTRRRQLLRTPRGLAPCTLARTTLPCCDKPFCGRCVCVIRT